MYSFEQTPFDTLISRGVEASQSNDGARAIELFVKASELRPLAGLPHFLRGSEYAALGQLDHAEAAFANATLLEPEFHLARYQLGLLQFSSGRAAMALLTWRPLLVLPETDPLPHFIDGFASLAQDRFDEALTHYRRGLALNAANPALSKDIDMVIARIRALGYREASDLATGSEEARALLANYQQNGLAH